MIDIEIRGSSRKDLETILDLLEKNKLRTEDVSELVSNFSLAIYGGEVVGCIGHEVLENGIISIRSLVVAEGYRRNGIGTKLIKTKIEFAKKNFREIYAGPLKTNLEGRRLLEKSDFHRMGKEERYRIFSRCNSCKEDYNKMTRYCQENSTDGCPILTYRLLI